MKLALHTALVLLLAALAPAALGLDRIKSRQGSQLSGEITATTPTQVTIKIGATNREVAVNDIESVQFDDEPNGLTQARFAVKAGKFTEALGLLDKIPPSELKRPIVSKDVDYYSALASARAALAGSGSIAEAGKKMFAFEKANKDSFHYYEASEIVGDLLVALGNFPAAETFYGKLAEAPWPNYQIRAGVLIGRALVGQKKYAEAITRFDQVLASPAGDPESQAQKIAAKLGKASALSAEGKVDQAVPLVEQVIETARADDEDLHARAYNILGNCYQTAGKPKEAILAFLHVDLLYPAAATQHAEALAHLAKLFTEQNKPQRAAQARTMLTEKYPDSVWAKQ